MANANSAFKRVSAEYIFSPQTVRFNWNILTTIVMFFMISAPPPAFFHTFSQSPFLMVQLESFLHFLPQQC